MATFQGFRKVTKSKYSSLLLILFIFGLYVFQNKAVTPFVESVAESSIFDVDTSELGNKDRSKIALLQCNDFVRSELDSAQSVEFANNDFKSWELSEGRYLVTSHVLERDASGTSVTKNFACNVQFTGGDDTDHENWSLQGLEIRSL